MASKSINEDILLPTGTTIVPNTYQIRFGTGGAYSTAVSAATFQSTHGIRITPTNYTFPGNPQIQYTDFLLETGLNSVIYPDNQRIFIKFRVVYPNSKQVDIVFIIGAGSPPPP